MYGMLLYFKGYSYQGVCELSSTKIIRGTVLLLDLLKNLDLADTY
jgi:hypothetical protein